MLAGIRLLRRIGLAAGAYYLGYEVVHLWAPGATSSDTSFATAAAIVAFFLPAVEASSFESKEK